jgi:competence protein ComFC
MGKTALYSALKLLFPPQCLHCKKQHQDLSSPLCETCITFLEPLPPTKNVLITFEGVGPALSIMTALKKGYAPKLASILAAYMAIQYSRSDLPLPDLVTSVPASFWRKLQMGTPISILLGQELARLLDRPFALLLQRKRQLFRQDFLNEEERSLLPSHEFQWKKKISLHSKTILLVDDTITTGTTLSICARRLWESAPKNVIKMACVDRGYLKM